MGARPRPGAPAARLDAGTARPARPVSVRVRRGARAGRRSPDGDVLAAGVAQRRGRRARRWPPRARPTCPPAPAEGGDLRAATCTVRPDPWTRSDRRRPRRAVRGAARARLHGRRPHGPRGSIVYDELASAADLPGGWVDVQDGGTLPPRARAATRRCSRTRSGTTRSSASSSRRRVRVWHGPRRRRRRRARGEPSAAALRVPRRALVRPARRRDPGSRASSTARHVEPDYAARRARRVLRRGQLRARRRHLLLRRRWTPARARAAGFDLALTELLDERGHRFLVEVGSDRGAEVLADVARAAPTAADERRGRRGETRRAPRRRWAAALDTDRPARAAATTTPSTRAGTTSPTAA